jgi:hypothetical protein
MNLKKLLTKTGVIIMAMSTITGLSGCNPVTQNRFKQAERLLNEKYGEVFLTESIGGSTIGSETYIAYSYLVSNPEVRVITYVEKDGKWIRDNYQIELVESELVNTFRQQFVERSITAEVAVYSGFTESKNNKAIFTYSELYEIDPKFYYLLFIMIDENDLGTVFSEKMYASFTDFLKKFEHFNGKFQIYIMPSDRFAESKGAMSQLYVFGSKFDTLTLNLRSIEVRISDGSIQLDLADFSKSLAGDQ